MPRNELKILSDLGQTFGSAELSKQVENEEFSEQTRVLIDSECLRIQDVLTGVVFTVADESIVERYIQHHQTGIIHLSDSLNSRLSSLMAEPEKKTNVLLIELLKFFLSRLFDLLNFIERFFSKYFNLDAPVPAAYKSIMQLDMAAKIKEVQKGLEERVDNPNLKGCLNDYYKTFSESNHIIHITFRDIIYLKEFVRETNLILKEPNSADWNTQFINKLIYLNFNHLAFFNYYQQKIDKELQETESKEHYAVVLSRSLSILKSIQSKPGFSYHTAWPNIKNMLESWLSGELELAVLPFRNGVLVRDNQETNSEKLMLNLPVSQIACLLKLFYDEGCLQSLSITDLFKFTVRNFRSKRQEKISTGSLSKEYYSIGQKTAAQTMDLLQKMVIRINKNYFPVAAAIYITYCIS